MAARDGNRGRRPSVKLVCQRSEHPGRLPVDNFTVADDPDSLIARLLILTERVPGMLYQYRLRPDGTSHIPYTTAGIQNIYGVTPEMVQGDALCLFERLHPEDVAEVGRLVIESAETLKPWSATFRVNHPDGRQLWVRGHAVPNRLDDGSVLWNGYIFDVTEQKETEIALSQRERHLQAMFDAEPECVKVVSANGELLDMNAAGLKMLEVESLEDAKSRPLASFLVLDYVEDYLQAHARALAGESVSIEFEIVGLKGTRRWMEARMVPLMGQLGEPTVLSITRDITDRKTLEHNLLAAARTDMLTGLCNRTLLVERLQQRLDRRNRSFAVLFLDVDRFKLINDSMGHHVGDQMLLEVSRRLRKVVRSSDSISTAATGNTVARLGGDEFVLLLEDVGSAEKAGAAATRILEALRKPYLLNGHRIVTNASVGVVFCQSEYDRAEDVIRDADTAMYEAKRAGRGRYVTFDPSMRDRVQWLVALEDELRLALDHQEFRLHYQPIVRLDSGDVCGYEALVRWLHPAHGIISPGDFIPIAEDTGLILPLGDFVFRQAVMDARRWTDGGTQAYASINISPHQIMEPVWISRFEDHLSIAGIPASSVQLEITESTVMHDFERAVSLLGELRSAGFKIALDDFGTGYSSLAWLHRLPIDVLKFDRSFISQMQGNVIKLIRGLATTAHDLGITVIAEGIETTEQRDVLLEIGCIYGQGYLFGRPTPLESIEGMAQAA